MPERDRNPSQFLNNTDLPDDEARELVGRLTEIVKRSETAFEEHRRKAQESLAIIRNQFWSKEDLEFFDEFDITPYQIPEARAPFNRLFQEQRAMRYDFHLIPEDKHAFERHRRKREEFVEKHGHEFDSLKDAQEYFDRYADDEFAESVTVYLDKFRNRTNAKSNESQVFENGVITGCDFFKTVFSTKNNPDGQLERERRSIRQMFWDINSVDYFLSDVEYIGEVQRFYKHDLISLWPELAEQIEKKYSEYTNLNAGTYMPSQHKVDWQHFYEFDSVHDQPQLRVVEIWHQQIEERYQLVNRETGDARLIQYGLEEDEIYDLLYEEVLDELLLEAERGELDPDFFTQGEEAVRSEVARITEERFELRTTQAKVMYKTVFSHNALFEHIRNPLPSGSHPYTPFFPQFTDGWWVSVVDDVKDIILALNKAVMFRELIQAHSAKGVLVVDRKTLNKSGYSIEALRQSWTEIGAVVDLDLAGGRRLSDVFEHINTMHQGLSEITLVINELKQRLYEIIGVNPAMLGNVGNEAAAAQVRQRILQGSATNGIIYDNFNQSLEYHIKHKEIPLIAHEMMVRPQRAIRKVGESRGEWIELNYNEDFELFVDTLSKGDFTFKLVPKTVDTQFEQQQAAMILQLAMAHPEIDVEAALEFSNIPFAHRFLRRNREIIRRKQNQALQNQIGIDEVVQTALQLGVDTQTADEMARKLRLQRAKELQEGEGAQRQRGQGASTIQSLASESMRQEAIFNETMEN